MKKITLIFIILLFFPAFLYSNGLGIGLGTIGYGVSFDTGVPDGYVSGRLLDFTYQTGIGLGLSLSPYVFRYSYLDDDFSYSFINISLFYNFLKYTQNNFILGPFFSINAVNIENPQYMAFSSGLTFSLRFSSENDNIFYFFNLLNIELGYRNIINSRQGFYAEANIDLLSVFVIFYLSTYSQYEGERDRYYEENPVYPPVLPKPPD